ncbi:hypothetical protein AB0J68_24715, partial [Micromonospora sp. NPDC049580]|uniref:hypothetical protein n=1 Tax=Micromonospora sp. NPDC049580 TaxID=3154832 RepID=UPI00344A0B13
ARLRAVRLDPCAGRAPPETLRRALSVVLARASVNCRYRCRRVLPRGLIGSTFLMSGVSWWPGHPDFKEAELIKALVGRPG